MRVDEEAAAGLAPNDDKDNFEPDKVAGKRMVGEEPAVGEGGVRTIEEVRAEELGVIMGEWVKIGDGVGEGAEAGT